MLLTAGSSALAVADDGIALTEDDFFTPFPEVLTATRLVQRLSDAPVAMTVIDREMIDASSAVHVVDLLRLVPGFQVARKEGIDTIGTYQGFADDFPRNMQVLIDGRSVYDPGLNGTVWSSIPLTLNQIERLEVVRGSNAAAYGSNAVMGTINIITRAAEVSDSLGVRAMGGTGGVAEGEFSHAAVHGAAAYRIDASRARDGGLVDKFDTSKSTIVNLQGSYRPTLDDELTVRLGGRQTDFDSESFRYPRKRVFKSDYQQFNWRRMLDSEEDIQLQLYRNNFRSPDVANIGVGIVDYSLQSERLDVELQHRWKPAEDWRMSWGAGTRRDTVSGGIFDTTDDMRRDQVRAFSNLEWRATDDLLINGGLMAEHYNDVGDYFSPRLAANWQFDPHQTIRASVARAYRVATFVERRGDVRVQTPFGNIPVVFGDSRLEAVQVDSVELAYLRELPVWDGTLDVRLFHIEHDPVIDDVDDENNTPANDDVRRFIEAGEFDVNGVEIQLRLRPRQGSLVHLAYAYADAGGGRLETINWVDPADGIPHPNDDKVPNHTLTVMAAQSLGNGWTLSGTYSYVSAMTWMGEGEAVKRLSRLDAKLAKRVRSANGDWRFSLNAQNLFDDAHYEFEPADPTIPLPGNRAERRVMFQVEYFLR
ncbi:MAG: TonB-dependent receptor [Gammaproteobacteria bacterium]|nr:TonB-dependent receptor [Gammaproteobacteria bacterium]